MVYQIMAPQVIDTETSELLEFTPNNIAELPNETLERLVADAKRIDKFKTVGEKELKERLEKGGKFSKVSFAKPAIEKVLTNDNKRKRELVIKYGWDCVKLETLTQLKKIYGEKIEDEISDLIVEKPKKPALKWE
ncbi:MULTISPECIES: hypothetical protein [unclassified Enterococcus]|uniref:hypothetical protein n=1 Tax=unclassified Enterococcus TaxID=2608891 RepID=UPI001551AFD8|nr:MULTISPECIES: hypothetical protein [unclassified Enterococcus]MBS7578322.1 hypothetical protein [Enterococcus sp. MMGLQ5-2]MBS7585467.1 hypothetical protein [Enterococcus sp. MMGLQ5-1]NPD13324.1 hypothetical protein [Enterococcus sp. MMGLQ5-1]NPD38153.1 hypothetical protein [Enterococcus sp. MMGLQ5-2]